MTDTTRLFVALMADPQLQKQLESYQSQWKWAAGARLVPAANFHLTLRFLGELDARSKLKLLEWLRLVPLEPFKLHLTTPGSFEGGVAWVGPARSDRLEALHERVNAAATWAGFPLLGEPWAPHVTLARKCSGSAPPELAPRLSWQAERFALMASENGTYRQIASWPSGSASHPG